MSMASNFVYPIIRRSNRVQLVVALLIAVLILAAVGLAQQYYYNQFNGPFSIPKHELLKIDSLNDVREYYVTVEGDHAALTGITKHSSEYGLRDRDDNYVALSLDDRFLLVEIQGNPMFLQADFDPANTQYTGTLVPIPSDIRQEIIDTIVANEPEINGRFLPFMLKTENFGTWGYLTPVVAGIVLVISLWIIVRAIRRAQDYAKHPIMHKLTRFGDAKHVAEMIDLDMKRDHEVIDQKVHLTHSWLVYPTALSLEATKLHDVMWIHEQIIQHQRNFIPTKKTYAALIWDRHGICIKVPCEQEFMNSILSAVARHSPGAVRGYQTNTDAAWNNDRDAFIQAVDKRRDEAKAK
jgi:hypothetical protein